jgi:deoxyribonuclease IV
MPQTKVGPGGTSGLGYELGLKEINSLKLEALEVEFTYGVRMSNAEAKRIGDLAKKLNIKLSVHAPYYINLASLDAKKIAASKKRILDSCERAHYLNAKNVVFHAGFYQKKDKEDIYQIIKKELIDLQKIIKEKKWNSQLCPETTGKKTQFGSLEELQRLKDEIGINYCVDFSHLLAREGKIDYKKLLEKLPKRFHAHYSGIEYGEKGERRHLLVDMADFKKLAEELKKQDKNVTIICESPDPISDAEKMKKVL